MQEIVAACIIFQDIKFRKLDNETVRGLFLGRYWFDISASTLREKIGEFTIENGALLFTQVDEDHAWKRFDPILGNCFNHL